MIFASDRSFPLRLLLDFCRFEIWLLGYFEANEICLIEVVPERRNKSNKSKGKEWKKVSRLPPFSKFI